jgi:hypothetical protein
LIARTEATSGGDASLVIPMRVQSTFDSTPGKRDRRLFLMVDGERLDAPLQVTYSVPAVADLEPDGSEFRVLAGKPAEEHRYDFPARTYRVRSNSPWAVEVVSRADTVTKEPYFLEVQCEDGSFVKVSPDTPVRAASGPKTGSGGVSVPVRLRVTLGDLAPAGEYGSPLEVRTRLLD